MSSSSFMARGWCATIILLTACSGGGRPLAPVSAPGLAPAETPAAGPAARIDQYLVSIYRPGQPGAAVIVVKNGATVLRKAYGDADVGRRVPMTPESQLRIGSVTKQFTAAAIMLLANEGKLALNDDITRFLPGYPTKGKKISIEHLLTHTGGIANFTSQPDFFRTVTMDMTMPQMVQRIMEYPIEFEAGSRFAYTNSGYILLGAIIEKVSGETYADFMARRIFEPLGMHDTAYEGHERGTAVRALGHSPRGGGYGPSAVISMTQPHAGGALVSTVDDLARWDQAISAGKLLPEPSWKAMFAPYRFNDGTLSRYAYGFDVSALHGSPAMAHGGAIPGFLTYALRMPDQKIYVAVLANTDGGMVIPEQVAQRIAAIAMQ